MRNERTSARKVGTTKAGPVNGKGQSTDATLPRSRLVLINTLPGRVAR